MEELFITKKDLEHIFNKGKNKTSDYMIAKIFSEIRKRDIEELTKTNQILPDKKYVTTKNARAYLRPYGVTI